jgi:hypothetical protein
MQEQRTCKNREQAERKQVGAENKERTEVDGDIFLHCTFAEIYALSGARDVG